MTSQNVRLDIKSNLIGTAPQRTAHTYINLLIYEDYGKCLSVYLYAHIFVGACVAFKDMFKL